MRIFRLRQPTAATLLVCLLTLLVSSAVQAQAYPTRAVKLVVPLTAGGPGDVLGRVVAQQMSEVLGQPVTVENRGGANGNIGADYVAKAAPDGYTFLLASTPMMVSPSMYSHMTFSPLKDFSPISVVADFPLVLITNQSAPYKTIPELIQYAKKHPSELNYGSAGNGSVTHLAGELFAIMSQTKLTHVPYRGINEAITDLIGGRMQLSFAGAPIALANARSDKVRALATTGARRIEGVPDLPTIAEGGLVGYEVTVWYGVLAPVGTPQSVIQLWYQALVQIVKSEEVKKRWLSLGADAVYSETPAQFARQMSDDQTKWAKVVKESGATVQ